MCNLYSLTKGQAAIRDWFRASHDRTGNLPLFPGIFPDQMAPIVRNGAFSSVACDLAIYSSAWRVAALTGHPQTLVEAFNDGA
jgi:putative SOS response-associated peptidase YedK